MKLAVTNVETRATQEAHDVIEQTRAGRGVAVLLGETGSGKTTLLRAYQRQTYAGGRPTVLLYRAEVVNTPLSMLRTLLAAFDVDWKGDTRDAFPALTVEMRLHGVDAILVDDAQRLHAPTMDILRGLQERCGVALVLCGTARFRKRLVERCPELAHRVTRVYRMPLTVGEDAFAVMQGAQSPQRRNFGDTLVMARTLAQAGGGNMRRMTQMLDEARQRARSGHRAVSERLLAQVARQWPSRTFQLPREA